MKKFILKYGHLLACCAFSFVVIASNSNCTLPFYEPEEPAGLNKFKKLG